MGVRFVFPCVFSRCLACSCTCLSDGGVVSAFSKWCCGFERSSFEHTWNTKPSDCYLTEFSPSKDRTERHFSLLLRCRRHVRRLLSPGYFFLSRKSWRKNASGRRGACVGLPVYRVCYLVSSARKMLVYFYSSVWVLVTCGGQVRLRLFPIFQFFLEKKHDLLSLYFVTCRG